MIGTSVMKELDLGSIRQKKVNKKSCKSNNFEGFKQTPLNNSTNLIIKHLPWNSISILN